MTIPEFPLTPAVAVRVPAVLPAETIVEPQPYTSPDFDFATGLFRFSPSDRGQQFLLTSGRETLQNRVEKAILTERFRYLIYTPGYGIEFENQMGVGLPRSVAIAMVTRSIDETLLADRYVESVVIRVVDEAPSFDSVVMAIEVTSRPGAFIEGAVRIDTVKTVPLVMGRARRDTR